ncbi:MAG: glutamate synthase-related protein, partial [Cyclobacteriaceae bacterium]
MKARPLFITISLVLLITIALIAYFLWKPVLWSLIVIGPLICIGVADILQPKQAIKRNFPVIGQLRYVLESFRPEIMQYFVETDTEGTPVNRIFRSLVYQRAKNVSDTTPFGTKLDLYKTGYEVMAHSVFPKLEAELNHRPTTLIGNSQCKQPYESSILNISAMSFGSLSKNAVLALNKGAKIGGFAHNTGEGAISPYHLEPGGDLIWQIGTGYFGCRTKDGGFCADTFRKNAAQEAVKMIELKLSQGAKPG